MKKTTLSAVAFAALLSISFVVATPADKNYGGESDVAFGEKLWKAMDGYRDWKLTTGYFRGLSPHGKRVRLYSTWVTVDGKSWPIIVKDNFGGRGMTDETLEQDPDHWLKSTTIMLQRGPGYDEDNDNWYWAQYDTDGSLAKNEKGSLLAGRVGKGEAKGCLSCHSQADGGDYLFSNDE